MANAKADPLVGLSRKLDRGKLQKLSDSGECQLAFSNLLFTGFWFVVVMGIIFIPALCVGSLFVPRNKRLKSYNSGTVFAVEFADKFDRVLVALGGVRGVSWQIDLEKSLNLRETVPKLFTSIRKSFALFSSDSKPVINQGTAEAGGYSNERNLSCCKCEIVKRKLWFLLSLFLFVSIVCFIIAKLWDWLYWV
jgi:hypothetical protein